MTKNEAMRGRGPEERNLSRVTAALEPLRDLAIARAMDPRNVAKGGWLGVPTWLLALKVAEEAGELAKAVAQGTLAEVEHEAGDLVWSVAMLVAAVRVRSAVDSEGAP